MPNYLTDLEKQIARSMGYATEPGEPTPEPSIREPGKGFAFNSGVLKWEDTINQHLQQYPNVDSDFVKAVMQQESGGQNVTSHAGAHGPMQLMPATAKRHGVDIDNPQENIRGGISELSQLLEEFGGDKRKALAAYNWGGARRAFKEHPNDWENYLPEETSGYLQRIGAMVSIGKPQNIEEIIARSMGLELPKEEGIAAPVTPETDAGFQQYLQKYGVKDFGDPRSHYDYYAAYKAGAVPQKWSEAPIADRQEDIQQGRFAPGGDMQGALPDQYMWPDEYKLQGHPISPRAPDQINITQPKVPKIPERIPLDFTNYGVDPSEIKPPMPDVTTKEGLRQSVKEAGPIDAFFKEMGHAISFASDTDADEIRRELFPVPATVGAGVGMVAPALVPSSGLAKLAKVPRIAQVISKYGKAGKAAFDAMSRMAVTGGDYAIRNRAELTSDDPAVRNKAIKELAAYMAAAGVSVAPEMLKSGWFQPILQGLTGGAADVAAQAAIGTDPRSPEAAAQTIFQTVLSAVFGLGMARSGKPRIQKGEGEASIIPERWEGAATPEEMAARKAALTPEALQEAKREINVGVAETLPAVEQQKIRTGAARMAVRGEAAQMGEEEAGRVLEKAREAGAQMLPESGLPREEVPLPEVSLNRADVPREAVEQATEYADYLLRKQGGINVQQEEKGRVQIADVPREQTVSEPPQRAALASPEPQLAVSGVEGKPQIDLVKYDPRKRAEHELSEITDPETKNKEIKRRFDRLLGDYGVTKFDEIESIQREMDADGVSYAYERADGSNLGGLNKYYDDVHARADEDVKKVWGEVFASEVKKNGGIAGRDQGDEFIVLWPQKTAKEAYKIHQMIDKKVRAKIEKLGLSKIKHPKHSNIETGALDIDYGIVDATPGKYGEVDRVADALAAEMKLKKEVDFYQKNGYIYDEGAKKYVQGKPASQIGDRPEPSVSGSVKNLTEPTAAVPTQRAPEPVPAVEPAAVSAQRPEESRIGVYKPPQPKPSEIEGPGPAAPEEAQVRAAEGPPEPAGERLTLEETKPSEEPNPLLMGGVSPANLPKYVQHFNIEKSPNIDKRLLLVQQAEKYSPAIQKARDVPVRRWDEVTRLSQQTGVLARGINRKVGKALNDRELRAINDHLEKVTDDYKGALKWFHEHQTKGEVTEKDRVALAELANYHGFVLAQATGANTEAGRALAILRQIRNAKNQAESLAELSDQIKNGGFADADIKKLVNIIDKTKDPSAINKIPFWKKLVNSIYELWLNWGLLSNPITHSSNIVSNAMTSTLRTGAEKPIAAMIDPLIARFQKRKTERFLGEIVPEITGQLSAITRVFGAGKTGLNQGGINGMIKAIGQEFEQVQSMFGGKIEYPGKVKGRTGQAIRLPGNVLQAEDLVFKKMVYEGEVLSRIYRQAKIEGLNGSALLRRSQELIKMIADPATEDKIAAQIRRAAIQEADYRTYTQALGKIGQWLMQGRNKIPLLRIIVPFIRTPLNILKYGLERLPVSGEAILLKRIKSGELKGAEVSDQVAKLIVGHLMSIPVVLAAQAGLITGSGPKDKNERKALEATGWQPYEVKIGDKWYSYRRLEPLATVLGSAADFVEIARATKDEDKLTSLVAQLAGSVSKNITSKTFTEQAAEFYGAIQEPERYGSGFLKRFSTSLVPGTVRGIAQATDPRYRSKQTLGEYVQSTIPGTSKDLPAKRDVLGKEIEKEGGFAWNFIVPIRKRKAESNPILGEINRLRVPISMPSKKIYDQDLTTKQFDEYGRIAGEQTYALLTKLVDSPAYQKMNDTMRSEWIKKMISMGRDRARKTVSEKYDLKAIATIDRALERQGLGGEELELQRKEYLRKLKIPIPEE